MNGAADWLVTTRTTSPREGPRASGRRSPGPGGSARRELQRYRGLTVVGSSAARLGEPIPDLVVGPAPRAPGTVALS